MQLKCVGCGAPVPQEATRCAACGRPTDADGDGVPDALDRLVEAKARAILAEERRAEAAEKARQEAESAQEELRGKEQKLAKLAAVLEASASRSIFQILLQRIAVTALIAAVAWVPFGMMGHWLLFGLIGRSPAGPVLCPMQCPTCAGPGRVFNFLGPGTCSGECNYFICNNPEYDVDTLSYREVLLHSRELETYEVNGLLLYVTEGAMVAVVAGLLAGLGARGNKRKLQGEAAKANAQLAEVRGRLLQTTTRPAGQGPFR
jgi:hypothetical protein